MLAVESIKTVDAAIELLGKMSVHAAKSSSEIISK
jgi:hypothetical protein